MWFVRIVFCLFLVYGPRITWSMSDDEYRDTLENEYFTFVEKNESNYRVLDHLKSEVLEKERELTECEKHITKGFTDYLLIQRQKELIIKETGECKTEVKSLKKRAKLAEKDEKVQSALEKCRVKLEMESIVGECVCEECKETIEGLIHSIEHYTKQDYQCEEIKIEHKSMYYFMKKTLLVLSEELVYRADQLKYLRKEASDWYKTMVSYENEMIDLGKDQVNMKDDQDYLGEQIRILSKEYLACKKAHMTAEENRVTMKSVLLARNNEIEDTQTECDALERKIYLKMGFVQLHYVIFKILVAALVLGIGFELYQSHLWKMVLQSLLPKSKVLKKE